MNAYVRACMGSLGGRQHLASGYLAMALVDPDKTIPTFVALMGGFRSTLNGMFVCTVEVVLGCSVWGGKQYLLL